MGKTKIDGTGAKQKKTISLRAKAGNLTVVRVKCKYCGHHKQFNGNIAGQNIKKCCKCKRAVQ